MEPKWLIYSREHNAWWKPNSRGYTRSEADAGRYEKWQAHQICEGAGLDHMGGCNEFMYLAPESAVELAGLIEGGAARSAAPAAGEG